MAPSGKNSYASSLHSPTMPEVTTINHGKSFACACTANEGTCGPRRHVPLIGSAIVAADLLVGH
jgi:hypothetical protein